MTSKTSDVVVFEYMGINEDVPKNITHLQFHPMVTDTDGGFGTFMDCIHLREVVFNEGLQRIGHSDFWDCLALESITLPSTVTYVSHEAFRGCTSLREVVLNDGLREIGTRVFQHCTALERITIPSTVTKIGDGAFLGCDNLREVLLHENIIEMDKWTFTDCPTLEKFNFPSISSRLRIIIRAGHYQRDMERKIDEIRGVVTRRVSELLITATAMREGRNWNTVKRRLDEIVKLIGLYEMKEKTALFELALWKAKIDHAEGANIKRDACRVEVPGPVKDAILQYLRD